MGHKPSQRCRADAHPLHEEGGLEDSSWERNNRRARAALMGSAVVASGKRKDGKGIQWARKWQKATADWERRSRAVVMFDGMQRLSARCAGGAISLRKMRLDSSKINAYLQGVYLRSGGYSASPSPAF